MRVIKPSRLRQAYTDHPDAKIRVLVWYKLIREHYPNLSSLRAAFPTVDLVRVGQRDYYVFNIGGNHYRLVVGINFQTSKVYVKHFFTHREYDTWTEENR